MISKIGVLMLLFSVNINSLYAQNRNIIRPFGFNDDFMRYRSSTLGGGTGSELGRNPLFNLAYQFAYERLIGTRLSVGINFTRHASFKENMSKSPYSPIVSNVKSNAGFSQIGDYKETGFGLGYESRYYFGSFTQQGPASKYIAFSYQYCVFSQYLTNYGYRNNNMQKYSSITYDNQEFSVHRYGIKIGSSFARKVAGDFYIGVYYNASKGINEQWKTGTEIIPVSVNAGMAFGLPF
jgi:hypothetical protein